MEWFKDWFDTKYYHILYKNRDQEEAEKFLIKLSKLEYFKENSKIIDIACGKGRHSLFLSKLGYDVTGIDLSHNSIKTAKKHERENLRFDISDMREVYQESTFDIALNLFTSFGYFKTILDDKKSISSMSKNLKNNGILVIDFLNTKKIIPNLITKENIEIDNILFKIKRNISNGYIIKDIYLKDQEKEYKFTEKVRILTLENFNNYLTFAGMKIIDTFGNYNLERFNNKLSERLIIIAKKC